MSFLQLTLKTMHWKRTNYVCLQEKIHVTCLKDYVIKTNFVPLQQSLSYPSHLWLTQFIANNIECCSKSHVLHDTKVTILSWLGQ